MKPFYITNNRLSKAWLDCKQTAKKVFLSTLMVTGIASPFLAQTTEETPIETYEKPSWWFGVAGGANFNFYQGSTQELNETMTPPLAFHEGFGVGLFCAAEERRGWELGGGALGICGRHRGERGGEGEVSESAVGAVSVS